jgi:hypothetical protein
LIPAQYSQIAAHEPIENMMIQNQPRDVCLKTRLTPLIGGTVAVNTIDAIEKMMAFIASGCISMRFHLPITTASPDANDDPIAKPYPPALDELAVFVGEDNSGDSQRMNRRNAGCEISQQIFESAKCEEVAQPGGFAEETFGSIIASEASKSLSLEGWQSQRGNCRCTTMRSPRR